MAARKPTRIVRRTFTAVKTTPPAAPRPPAAKLVNVTADLTKLVLPEPRPFNGAIVAAGNGACWLAYRPDERTLAGCKLGPDLVPIPGSFTRFAGTNMSDPRLIWLPDGRLLMVYSWYPETDMAREGVWGSIVMHDSAGPFLLVSPHRISPESLPGRQKNWVPFVHDGAVYLIASVRPHIVYRLDMRGDDWQATQMYETQWAAPWFHPEQFMRGNTPPLQLDDGTWLNTFHTVQRRAGMSYYDNGCYIFSGTPPFQVLACADRTYLPAEAAVEYHPNKAGKLKCTFPVGLIQIGDSVVISYGDNDVAVKVMRVPLQRLVQGLIPVYGV